MPKLPQFLVQHETLGAEISGGRRATPADAGAGVGEELQGLGHTVQKAVTEYRDDQEAGDARTVLMRNAQIREKYGKLLDEAEISGGDTDKIKQAMDDEMAGVRGDLKTQRGIQYADQHSAGTSEMFNGKVGQIKVERARAEAVLGGQQLMQANAGLIYSNPSYLTVAEESIDAYAGTQTRLPPQARAKLAADLKAQARVQAAGRSAELDPEGTQAALKAGQWQLSPEQMAQVSHQADREVHRRQTEKRIADEEARTAAREASNKARKGHFAAIEAAKPGEMTKVYNEIMADKHLDEVDQEHLVVYIEQKRRHDAGDERQSNKIVRDQLAARIWAPYGDPRKITTDEELLAALQRRDLNYPDFKALNRDVTEARDGNNSTYAQARSQARTTMQRALLADPRYAAQPFLQSEILGRWDALARDRATQDRAAGKPPERAFNASEKDSIVSASVWAQIDRDARAGLAGERTAAQLAPGTVKGGFKFKGGDPAVQTNWEPAAGQADTPAPAAAPKPQTAARPSFNGVTVPAAATRGQGLDARIKSEYPRRRGESGSVYDQRIAELVKRAREGGAE